MSEFLAVFMWGFGAGMMLATFLHERRARQPTQEHLVGAKIIEAGKDVLFTQLVSGEGVEITNRCVLKIDQQTVTIAVSNSNKAAA